MSATACTCVRGERFELLIVDPDCTANHAFDEEPAHDAH